MRHATWILAAAAYLALAACGNSTGLYGGGSGSGSGGGSTITVNNDFFSPSSATVQAGAVTFTWATPSHGHTLTWDSGPGTLPANTGVITSGTRTVTLQPGTYQYHCSVHGAPGIGMHGTIVVQ